MVICLPQDVNVGLPVCLNSFRTSMIKQNHNSPWLQCGKPGWKPGRTTLPQKNSLNVLKVIIDWSNCILNLCRYRSTWNTTFKTLWKSGSHCTLCKIYPACRLVRTSNSEDWLVASVWINSTTMLGHMSSSCKGTKKISCTVKDKLTCK